MTTLATDRMGMVDLDVVVGDQSEGIIFGDRCGGRCSCFFPAWFPSPAGDAPLGAVRVGDIAIDDDVIGGANRQVPGDCCSCRPGCRSPTNASPSESWVANRSTRIAGHGVAVGGVVTAGLCVRMPTIGGIVNGLAPAPNSRLFVLTVEATASLT